MGYCPCLWASCVCILMLWCGCCCWCGSASPAWVLLQCEHQRSKMVTGHTTCFHHQLQDACGGTCSAEGRRQVPLPVANVLTSVVLLLELQELNFTTIVAPTAEAVFDELRDTLQPYYIGDNAPLPAVNATEDEDGSSGPSGALNMAVLARLGSGLESMQQYVARAGLLLWLWFDQQCEQMAEQVSRGTRWCLG